MAAEQPELGGQMSPERTKELQSMIFMLRLDAARELEIAMKHEIAANDFAAQADKLEAELEEQE